MLGAPPKNEAYQENARCVKLKNITLIFLPSRSPELNPVENIWQCLRSNWLSSLVFDSYYEIIEAACAAWNKHTALPDVITSIGTRTWAKIGQA
jgi:transposase